MTPKDFTNHSGGAQGADLMWDTIGREHGFENHRHWLPEDLDFISDETTQIIRKDVITAAKALDRPTSFKGIELVRRNWFQVHYSQANIYAIAPILQPGMSNLRGMKNTTGKPVVDGGTGWTVEMAIQKTGLVFVFDTRTNKWYNWEYGVNDFRPMNHIPLLTTLYAGIGSRAITPLGAAAIQDVYLATLQSLQKLTHG